MDNRNYDVTNKIFKVLNDIKGFDVAMSNPRKGKILIRYNDIDFIVSIDPVFNKDEKIKEENKPFNEVAKNHRYIWQ